MTTVPARMLNEMLESRLTMYMLAAGATLAAGPANAQVLFTPNNTVLNEPSKLAIDLDHDGSADFLVKVKLVHSFSGYQFVGGAKAYGLRRYNEIGVNRYGAAALRKKERIGSGRAFSTSAVLATGFGYVGNWANVSDGYLGVRFLIKGEVHYGWIGFRNVTAKRTVVVKLAGWAYETQPDKAILAGDTGTSATASSFQPTSLEILASGHTAIDQRRKRTASLENLHD